MVDMQNSVHVQQELTEETWIFINDRSSEKTLNVGKKKNKKTEEHYFQCGFAPVLVKQTFYEMADM